MLECVSSSSIKYIMLATTYHLKIKVVSMLYKNENKYYKVSKLLLMTVIELVFADCFIK